MSVGDQADFDGFVAHAFALEQAVGLPSLTIMQQQVRDMRFCKASFCATECHRSSCRCAITRCNQDVGTTMLYTHALE
jgi:hypothetical protein